VLVNALLKPTQLASAAKAAVSAFQKSAVSHKKCQFLSAISGLSEGTSLRVNSWSSSYHVGVHRVSAAFSLTVVLAFDRL